jgi:hypothetical protein
LAEDTPQFWCLAHAPHIVVVMFRSAGIFVVALMAMAIFHVVVLHMVT